MKLGFACCTLVCLFLSGCCCRTGIALSPAPSRSADQRFASRAEMSACDLPESENSLHSLSGFSVFPHTLAYTTSEFAQVVFGSNPDDPTSLYEVVISEEASSDPGYLYVNLCEGGVWIRDDIQQTGATSKDPHAIPWYRPRVRVKRVVAVTDGTEYAVVRLANGLLVYCVGPDGKCVKVRDSGGADDGDDESDDVDGPLLTTVNAGQCAFIDFRASGAPRLRDLWPIASAPANSLFNSLIIAAPDEPQP